MNMKRGKKRKREAKSEQGSSEEPKAKTSKQEAAKRPKTSNTKTKTRRKLKEKSDEDEKENEKKRNANPVQAEAQEYKEVLSQIKHLLKSKQTKFTGLKKLSDVCREESEQTQHIIEAFLKTSPECKEIFSCLDSEERLSAHEARQIWDALEGILLVTSEQQTRLHSYGMFIVNKVLHNYLKQIYSAFSSACPAALTRTVLRLLTAMLAQGPHAVKEILACFDFTLKGIQTIPRRRDLKITPDVRTCFVRFFLAFFVFGDLNSVKKVLEINVFSSGVFGGIVKDPSAAILLVLSTLKDKVVNEGSLLKKTKLRFFNKFTLNQLVNLLDYSNEDDDDDGRADSIKQIANKMLLTLCADEKLGICFPNKLGAFASRSNNPVLLGFLSSLKIMATPDSKVQDLILKTLSTSPDVIYPYISRLQLTMEPRLSSPWLKAIGFVTKIWTGLPPLSVLVESQKVSSKNLSRFVNLIVPSIITKPILTHGLKNEALMVKLKILEILLAIMSRAIEGISIILQQSKFEDPQPNVTKVDDSLKREFLELIFKNLPDVKALIRLRQELAEKSWKGISENDSKMDVDDKEEGDVDQNVKEAQVTEELSGDSINKRQLLTYVLQAFKCYQHLQPGIWSESGFNLCKLLNFTDKDDIVNESQMLLFTIQTLLAEPRRGIKWLEKKSKLNSGAVKMVLKIMLNSASSDVCEAASCLFGKILIETGFFDDYFDEVHLWIRQAVQLPKTGEYDCLVEFIYETCHCVACDPYAFIDEIQEAMVSSTETSEDDRGRSKRNLLPLQDSRRLPISPLVSAALNQFTCLVKSESEDESRLGITSNFLTKALEQLFLTQENPFVISSIILEKLKSFSADKNWFDSWKRLKSYVELWSTGLGLDVTAQLGHEANTEGLSKFPENYDMLKHEVLESKNLMDVIKILFPLQGNIKTLSMQLDSLKDTAVQDHLKTQLSENLFLPGTEVINALFLCLSNLQKVTLEVQSKKLTKKSRFATKFLFELLLKSLQLFRESEEKSIKSNGPDDFQTHSHGPSLRLDFGKKSKTNDHSAFANFVLSHPVLKDAFLSSNPVLNFWTPLISEIILECLSYQTSDNLGSSGMEPYMNRLAEKTLEMFKDGTEACCELDSMVHSTMQQFIPLAKTDFCVNLFESLSDVLTEGKADKITSNGVFDILLVLLRRMKGAQDKTGLGVSKNSVVGESFVKPSVVEKLLKIFETSESDSVDQLLLEIIQADNPVILSTRSSIIKLCLRYISPCKIEIIKHLTIRSSFEAYYFVDKFHKLMKAVDGTYVDLIPVTHAVLFRGESVVRRDLALKVKKHCFKGLIKMVVSPEESTDLPDNLTKMTEEILIELTKISNERELVSLLEQTLEIPDAKSPPKRYYFQLQYACLEALSCGIKASWSTTLLSWCLQLWEALISSKESRAQDELTTEKDLKALVTKLCKGLQKLREMDSSIQMLTKSWASFFKVFLRRNIFNASSMLIVRDLLFTLYSSAAFKSKSTLTLESIYQLILGHSQFLELVLEESEDQASDSAKGALIRLLLTVAELCPTVCKETHLPIFLAAYSASLSSTDQYILSLLQLYETNRVPLLSQRPLLWGKSSLKMSHDADTKTKSLWKQQNIQDVIELLDTNRLIKSAFQFPLTRTMKDWLIAPESNSEIYDPVFLLPLFSYLLGPGFEVDCRKFLDSGCLAFVISALSSYDDVMRQASYHVLVRYMNSLEGARFREKNQVQLLLKAFKNSITEGGLRISSIICSFIIRTLQLFTKTDQHLYPIVNSFLLQKPSIDLRDVPLFFSLFNSTGLQFNIERTWILRLLVSGMRDASDYYIYKRRHVFELAMSFHDSRLSDVQSKKIVIELLLAGCKIQQAAYDLVQNYGLLSWLHSKCIGNEARKDTEIVENVAKIIKIITDAFRKGIIDLKSGKATGNNDVRKTPVPANFQQECILLCLTILRCKRLQPKLDLQFIITDCMVKALEMKAGGVKATSHLALENVVDLLENCLRFSEQKDSELPSETQMDNSENVESGNKLQSLFHSAMCLVNKWFHHLILSFPTPSGNTDESENALVESDSQFPAPEEESPSCTSLFSRYEKPVYISKQTSSHRLSPLILLDMSLKLADKLSIRGLVSNVIMEDTIYLIAQCAKLVSNNWTLNLLQGLSLHTVITKLLELRVKCPDGEVRNLEIAGLKPASSELEPVLVDCLIFHANSFLLALVSKITQVEELPDLQRLAIDNFFRHLHKILHTEAYSSILQGDTFSILNSDFIRSSRTVQSVAFDENMGISNAAVRILFEEMFKLHDSPTQYFTFLRDKGINLDSQQK